MSLLICVFGGVMRNLVDNVVCSAVFSPLLRC